MTILTTIAYDNQARRVGITGPEACSGCGRSLTTRNPDRKDISVQPSTNAELNLYIYESDDDGHGGGLCESCHVDSEQAPLWLMLAKWQARNPDGRFVEIGRSGVRLFADGKTTQLETVGGLLSASDVHTVTAERPGMQGAARFDLLAGDVCETNYGQPLFDITSYTRADSDADELAAATSFALSGRFDATSEDECPKTERNDR